MSWLSQFINFKFYWINAIWFGLGFVLFTIIGTLSHEAGHYIVAKQYFNSPSFHYGYVKYGDWKEVEPDWYNQRLDENDQLKPEFQEEFDRLLAMNKEQHFYTTLGGPLQTVFFGTIGFIWLLYRKKNSFALKDWLLVFLAFFWSREVYMICSQMFTWIQTGKLSSRSDETNLSSFFEWHPLSVSLMLGSIGFIIICYIIFFIIPLRHRFTFLISGFVGSIFGFWFWLDFLGPLILP
ncbi:hypothetical protein SAMN05192588_2597 [Nonlabens sp. Hel1_33_55]|uniref:hypothetical protein n=1 Tax=Nonlabens sp. Hel1_33_55 TaxID=1336802 RepID=UPI000875D9AD|nr:hypothetical protein [Nonlabens sp. Hel1_33_55]SCY38399.1 hypothetical protein SAMN05192588_2597 [Nonlabens sp. Hel1_33_55]